MKSYSKRLAEIEKVVVSRKYLDVVVIRRDEELEKYSGKIGPVTNVIKIVPRKERLGSA